MTDPFSRTYRNGRKFSRRRQRQMAFLKALGETGSVAHAAAIVDVDRTSPYTGRSTLPGFASAWEAALAEAAARLFRHGAGPLERPPAHVRDGQVLPSPLSPPMPRVKLDTSHDTKCALILCL